MNPQHLIKRIAEMQRELDQMRARLDALENKPRVGRPPKDAKVPVTFMAAEADGSYR